MVTDKSPIFIPAMQIERLILKSDSHGASGRGHRWRRGACEPPARRAAGRYRVTDSRAGVTLADEFPACFARLRAFLMRQCL